MAALPRLNDIKYRLARVVIVMMVMMVIGLVDSCATHDVGVFLVVDIWGRMVCVCHHAAGGLQGQSPDTSGRARTWKHFAKRTEVFRNLSGSSFTHFDSLQRPYTLRFSLTTNITEHAHYHRLISK